MGAAVTVSNAETSRAVRAELFFFPSMLNVMMFFLPNLEEGMKENCPL